MHGRLLAGVRPGPPACWISCRRSSSCWGSGRPGEVTDHWPRSCARSVRRRPTRPAPRAAPPSRRREGRGHSPCVASAQARARDAPDRQQPLRPRADPASGRTCSRRGDRATLRRWPRLAAATTSFRAPRCPGSQRRTENTESWPPSATSEPFRHRSRPLHSPRIEPAEPLPAATLAGRLLRSGPQPSWPLAVSCCGDLLRCEAIFEGRPSSSVTSISVVRQVEVRGRVASGPGAVDPTSRSASRCSPTPIPVLYPSLAEPADAAVDLLHALLRLHLVLTGAGAAALAAALARRRPAASSRVPRGWRRDPSCPWATSGTISAGGLDRGRSRADHALAAPAGRRGLGAGAGRDDPRGITGLRAALAGALRRAARGATRLAATRCAGQRAAAADSCRRSGAAADLRPPRSCPRSSWPLARAAR